MVVIGVGLAWRTRQADKRTGSGREEGRALCVHGGSVWTRSGQVWSGLVSQSVSQSVRTVVSRGQSGQVPSRQVCSSQ